MTLHSFHLAEVPALVLAMRLDRAWKLVRRAAGHEQKFRDNVELPLLYTELASWFHLLSDPADYLEEATFFQQVLSEAVDPPPRTMLELGSGAGSNAAHLKAHYQMTLTDLSAGMLALSRTLNPECEHIEGDMRTLRLGRLFDAVFVHDAIEYMVTLEELRQALLAFRDTYNHTWLIERHGFLSPAEYRRQQLQPLAQAA